MFLFAINACGLRFSDIMTLRWKDIDFPNRRITKVQVKTRERATIPMTDAAMEILKEWRNMKRRNIFVFDLINDDTNINNDEVLNDVRNTVNKAINKSLKIVSEELELPFSITFHYARHTFAIIAINKGMNISAISSLLGHRSTAVTETVYAKYLPSKLQDEVMKLGLNFI